MKTREELIEFAIRDRLIDWCIVRFGVRVDSEAIFGDVCKSIASLLTLPPACPAHGPIDRCMHCENDRKCFPVEGATQEDYRG